MMNIEFPEKLLFYITEKKRYKVSYGGRGSSKSWTAGRGLILRAMQSKIRILCTRQLQTSIKDSVHKLLCDTIYALKLEQYFDITRDTIRCHNGSEFIFKGLQNQTNEIKSIEGIDICWVEEAQSVSEDSWAILIPTIRKENSEIWVTFNPDREEDATYQRFVVNPPPDSIVQLVNYYDNPWFPEVLRKEMEYDKQVDYAKYEHVWLGKTVLNTEAQIYHGKFELKEFATPENVTFYYGADWGFANDPTALVRCFIQDQCLYIDYESGGIGVEFEELPALFEKVPESRKWEIRADCARPETISYMSRQGFRTVACPKWKGSVEDGIEYIRSFRRIYVHPRCKHTYEEFKFYSYKVDKNTGDILPVVLDKDNHYMDALRYALNPYIQKNISILEVL
jgi:phage terminase large subunit